MNSRRSFSYGSLPVHQLRSACRKASRCGQRIAQHPLATSNPRPESLPSITSPYASSDISSVQSPSRQRLRTSIMLVPPLASRIMTIIHSLSEPQNRMMAAASVVSHKNAWAQSVASRFLISTSNRVSRPVQSSCCSPGFSPFNSLQGRTAPLHHGRALSDPEAPVGTEADCCKR